MTTMEKLIEAYLESEKIIKEQAQEIISLATEVKMLRSKADSMQNTLKESNSEISDLKAALRESEEANQWAKEFTRKNLYGKPISKEDREKGERFKSRLVFDSAEAKRIDDVVRKELGIDT